MAELKVDTTIDGNKAWQKGNDGSGSTLDADLLDGKNSSEFATSGHGHDGTYARIDGTATHNGNIKISGSTVYIRAGSAWKQVFPAVYS
jgi:hypothetical protein